jgi:hypothetical protein
MSQQPQKNNKLVDDFNGRWEQNKAFIYAINRKRDKAFSSMEDYVAKRDAMLAHYRAKRKTQSLKHGERKNWLFELSGSWDRLQPFLYIVGFIGLLWWALATKQFAPKGEPTIDVFGTRANHSKRYLPYVAVGEIIKAAYPTPAATTQPPNYLYYVIIILIIAVAYYGYKVWRSRKKG